MSLLDRETLQRFIELAGERLEGEWVVMGGIVLPLLGASHRVTVDIDIAGPPDAGREGILALFGIAAELGLPVETINQTGVYFLSQVDGWRDHLVVLHRGRRGTILRPDATLFVLLKLRRFTESDLTDCLAYLEYAAGHGEGVDRERLARAVQEILHAPETSEPKHDRIDQLLAALAAHDR